MSVYDAAYEVDWERVPLPPGRLAELNRRSDVLGLAQSLGHLGLLAATGAASWICAAQGWWLAFAVALFAHGTVASFMINAVHELVHGTVFRTRWLNTVFVHVFAFIGWINHRGFWASHAEHHLYTLHHPHDSEVVVPIRLGLRGFIRGAILNPFGMTWPLRHQWRLARGKIAPGWEGQVLASQDRRRAVISWSRSLFIGHAAVWTISAWQGWWLLPILVSLTPCYGHLLFSLLNNTQHVGLKAGARDFRENCRTIEVNAVFRFLYWHMNYHIEHHMYAAVPCYRLRALHREIAHALPPTPQGLAAAWAQIIHDVVRQQAEPGWYERPAIPGTTAEVAAPVQVATPPAAPTAEATITTMVWRCSICGFIYDEAAGLPEEGIPPGTAWADLPSDWACPDCGIAKADFAMVEVARPARAASATADQVPVVAGAGRPGDRPTA